MSLGFRVYKCLGCIFLFLILGASGAHSEVFFKDDFEGGSLTSGPSPSWSWKNPIAPGNINSGMMYGATDVYYVTDDIVHSGSYSLRMNFGGRNSWCNQCGASTFTLSESDAASGCVSTASDVWSDKIFNKTNGFSVWDVTSISSGQVCFNANNSVADSMFGGAANSIKAGDQIAIPYVCGVNGNVGGNISRKSDCNKAINYFNNVSATDIGYGETISRRFHMYIPSATALPGITLKLGYSHWRINGGVRSVKLKLSVQRGLQLELNSPSGETIVPKYYMEKDEWYYYEELFVRESAPGAGDAEYHLYFGKAGENLSTPLISRVGFNIGELVDMSMHGNWQHNNDVSGYVYFDDLIISNGYVGPAASDAVSKPSPPGNLQIVVSQ